jgi:hypothetical protein
MEGLSLLFFLYSQPVVVTINQEVDITSLDGKRSPV